MADPNAKVNAKETAEVTDALDRLADQPEEFRAEISAAAEEIGLDAAWRTPVDQGHLKASRSVEHSDEGSSITFGSPTAHYALYVHENERARHTVGEAKFLDKAVEAAMPELESRLSAILGKV